MGTRPTERQAVAAARQVAVVTREAGAAVANAAGWVVVQAAKAAAEGEREAQAGTAATVAHEAGAD